jgi:drug/metabolite transporter (DMT)-like permease
MLYVNALSVLAFLPAVGHPWPPAFSPWLLGILALGPAGMYCGIVAVRCADASTLAPYSYIRLVFASIGGLLVFGETLDWASISGAAIILAACILGSRTKSPARDGATETVPAAAPRV